MKKMSEEVLENEKNVTEIENQLQRLTTNDVDDDQRKEEEEDQSTDAIDKAIEALLALKKMKLKLKNQKKAYYDAMDDVPLEFRYPISKELMTDPVVLASGQTFDRIFVEDWLKQGHETCPKTQQHLLHTFLAPNLLVHYLIAQWCNDNGIEPPLPREYCDGITTNADCRRLLAFLEKMLSSISDQKEAAKEIRLLTEQKPSLCHVFFISPDNLPRLLTPLTTTQRDTLNEHPEFEEDLIACIVNLSKVEVNKKMIAANPCALPSLVESLRCGARTIAASALFSLSEPDSNKQLIVQAGAIKPLIELIHEGNPLAMKYASHTIFRLCTVPKNRQMAIREGALEVMERKIKDQVSVNELFPTLAFLTDDRYATAELANIEVVKCLLRIIRTNGCQTNREHSLAVLVEICLCNRDKLVEVAEDERLHKTISYISDNGNVRAQEMADSMILCIRCMELCQTHSLAVDTVEERSRLYTKP